MEFGLTGQGMAANIQTTLCLITAHCPQAAGMMEIMHWQGAACIAADEKSVDTKILH
jgi:hypothetical protein